MNIKVAAFTVSEKSINICVLFSNIHVYFFIPDQSFRCLTHRRNSFRDTSVLTPSRKLCLTYPVPTGGKDNNEQTSDV